MQHTTPVAASVSRWSSETLAYAGLTLTSFAWASAFIAGKVTLREITPLSAAAARYSLATMVLVPLAWQQQRSPVRLRGIVGPLAVMTLCGGVLYQWLFLLALSRTSATNTSLLIALNPVLTMLLSALLGERFDRRRVLGVLLTLTGAATVITAGRWERVADLATLSLRSGDLIAVAAALCWASFNVASRRVVAQLSSAFANSVVYGIGAVVLIALAWGEHPWRQITAASQPALMGIAVMALLSSVLAGQLFLFGIRTVGVSRTVVFVYLVPVLTALSSALLLGEQLVAAQVIGGSAVLAGVYWTTRA